MLVEGVCLGALCLYFDRPGPLTDDQHADALIIAELAAPAVLMMQANAAPRRDDLAEPATRAGGVEAPR